MTVVFIRTIILFALLSAALRIMGKRQLGELEPSELVVAILIANLAAIPMEEKGTSLFVGIIPIVTLICLEVLISGCVLKSQRLRSVIYGSPSILMHNGKIIEKSLRKNRLTNDELIEEIRLQGITDLSTIEFAILESSGKLSVIRRAAQSPPTADMMGLSPVDKGLPVMIINDGVLLEKNLSRCGLDQKWLQGQINAGHAKNIADVLILTVDDKKNTYILPKEKQK